MLNSETNRSGLSKKENLVKRNFKYEFWKEMKSVEGEKRKSLMRHTIERAFTDDQVLTAVLKKMLPDLSENEIGQNLIEVIRHLKDEDLKPK